MILTWLQAQAWKVATAGAAVMAIGLGLALVVEKHEHAATEKARVVLYDQIYAPGTGFLAVETQLRATNATLDAAVIRQNVEIQRQVDESAKRLAEAAQSLTVAQAATASAERRIGVLMRPLASGDVCKRMIEMDDRFLENLK